MASSVILILGAGANVGGHVAQQFAKNGYKVALAARSINAELAKTADLTIKADFAHPASIKAVFDEVKAKLGLPNVVVYNAAYAGTFTPKDPFQSSVEDISTGVTINTLSAYAAAKEAVAGFKELPSGTTKSFIYTGNRLNIEPMPVLLNLGIGKAASANFIHAAAIAYKEDGYSFYFADERKEDGSPIGMAINGKAHGDFYYELTQQKEQGPWDATFVDGKGFTDFAGK